MNKQKVVIGLEMHCEMTSNSKVFSSARNSYNELANDNVAPLDMAFPGTLPTLNKECVRKAILMSLALNCTVPEYFYFDRKNYYYPDLPKGYQISQMHNPIGTNGKVIIDCNGKEKTVFIHDIHLEEDSASLDHYSDATLIDYNRSGVPLLELVTEPCLNSADEAIAFLEEMRRIYRYLDVSEADTKKGQIRCDVNVSIMDEDSTTLGTKVEIKNVNSFANVREAINYEVDRQMKLKEAGRYAEVEQETRRFDEESGTTIRMRGKVDAIDYKYFVEPNLPKYKITKEYLESIKKTIPMLPRDRKLNYINKYNLSEHEASLIIKDKDYANYFDECINIGIDIKQAYNWLVGNITSYLNKEDISIKDFFIVPTYLKEIIDALNNNTISSKQAKEIFNESLSTNKEPKFFISTSNQVSNKDELENIIINILNNNTKQIEDYKNGKTNLFDYFVGQVMKETKGKANPVITKEILKDKLNN